MDKQITLHKFDVLRSIVELGGVGNAAEHWHVTQPVISAHLRSLEQRLGTTLIDRSSKKLTLTPAGERIYRWATELANRTRELEQDLRSLADGSRGAVVIAAGMSSGGYLIAEALVAYAAEHPDLELTLLVKDANAVLDAVASGAADLGILTSDAVGDSAELTVSVIGHDELVLVAAAHSQLPSLVTPPDVAGLRFVSAPGDLLRRSTEDDHLGRIGVRNRNIVLSLGHPEALKTAVRAGLGVALLFRSTVRAELAAGTLREITVAGADFTEPVVAVARRDRQPPPAVRLLLTYLGERLR